VLKRRIPQIVIGVEHGGARGEHAPPHKKKLGKIFFGQISSFVNFSYIYFQAKMSCPIVD